MVSRDLRFRVVALYFSRPLSRLAYVQAKLLAMSAAVFVLLALPLIVLYGGALLAQLPFWDNTRDLSSWLLPARSLFAIVLASIGLRHRGVHPAAGPRRRGRRSPCCSCSPVCPATVRSIAENQGNHGRERLVQSERPCRLCGADLAVHPRRRRADVGVPREELDRHAASGHDRRHRVRARDDRAGRRVLRLLTLRYRRVSVS